MATPRGLQEAIEAGDRRWDEGDEAWFELLADDAIVYAINHSEPFQNKDSYYKHFAPQLTRAKRKTTVLNRNIQVVDGAAVVAQTFQIWQEDLISNVRQSVVWHQTDANNFGWQIKHLHTALIGAPATATPPRDAGAIRVLNERIATMAAVLGVAQ